MQATIVIDMSGDAFADGLAPVEMARILDQLADDVFYDLTPCEIPLADVHGDIVGTCKIERKQRN